MFGSNLLDVAIGTIFTFLLLSLICSAANEILEGFLKNRATDLERGLRELLDPNTPVDKTGIIAKLYNHSLVNGLYKGKYEDFASYMESPKFIRWIVRFFRSRSLPSYIPARSFALALMDTVLPGTSAPASTDRKSGTAGATPPAAAAAPLVVVGAAAAAAATAPNPLQPLRDKIGELSQAQTRQALLALVDAADNDVNKARENIENWFNSSMDRVSGWYKRRAQVVIFVLGLGVAVAMNADSISLVKALSADKALRDSLVVAAEAYAKANAEPPASGTQDNKNSAGNKNGNQSGAQNQNPPPDGTAQGNNNSNQAGAQHQSAPLGGGAQGNKNSNQAGARNQNTPPDVAAQGNKNSNQAGAQNQNTPPDVAAQGNKKGKDGRTQNQSASSSAAQSDDTPPECEKDKNSPECKLAKTKKEIEKLGLPFGWDSKTDVLRKWPGNHWKRPGGWWFQLSQHGLGWLITALAVSLGAPFWFDMLNKFIVVRSTVKPHEKSGEEPSK